MRLIKKRVRFGDLGTAVVLGPTAVGDVVVRGGAYVLTAFNGTTPTLNIGFASDNQGGAADPDALSTVLDVSAVGLKAADELAATTNKICTVADKVTATFGVASGTPTAGEAIVWVEVLNDYRP